MNRPPLRGAHLAALALLFALAAPPAAATDYDVAAKGAADQKVFMDRSPFYPSAGSGVRQRLGGRSVAIADLSGDGTHDILFGSPFSEAISAPGPYDREGAAFYQKGPVVPGDNEFYDVTFVSTDTSGGRAFGRTAAARLGFAVAAGDMNGDGKADFVLGCAGDGGVGEVHVLFGGLSEFFNSVDSFSRRNLLLADATHRNEVDISISNLAGANFSSADTSGIVLALGDANGDGALDLAIGAPNYDAGRGAVYLVYGQGVGATINGAGPYTTTTIKRLDGASAGDRFGFSVAFGNVCGDAKADLIIGAPGAATSAGKVYVLRGADSSNWGGDCILSVASESGLLESVLSGTGAADEFGFAVAAGNLNGASGYDEVIVGARRPAGRGEVYAFHGAASLSATIAAASANARFQAPATGEHFGAALHAADFSGDGIADLVVGAPLGRNFADSANTGRAYLLYGDAALPAITDLSSPAAFAAAYVFYGEYPDGRFGCAVTSGFLSARTSRDLVVSAETGAGEGQNGETGCAYQIFYVRGPSAPAGVTAIPSPTRQATWSVAWTHVDPESQPQTAYQVQFAKDAGFTASLQDSGQRAGTASAYEVTLGGGDGAYWYRVRTFNQYNPGSWSAAQSFILDRQAPTAVETSAPQVWGGGTWTGRTARAITIRVDDNHSAAGTLGVFLWRANMPEDTDNDGVCDPGEGALQVLTTADPAGASRSFPMTVNDASVDPGKTVRIWLSGADLAGNAFAVKNAYNDPLIQYTLKSALGPLASDFTPAAGAYVSLTPNQPVVSVKIVDDDSAVNAATIEFSFNGDTKGINLAPPDNYLTYDPVTKVLTYSAIIDNRSFSNGTITAILARANDGDGNPLQNPTAWPIVLDNTPPSAVNDWFTLSGGTFPVQTTRQVRFAVTDNIRNASTLTVHFWRQTLDDANSNGVIDLAEIKTDTMSATAATGTGNFYDYYITETGMASGGRIALWVSGGDHTGNAFEGSVNGSKDAPIVDYRVHSVQGPTVVGYSPAPPAFFNDPRPAFSVTLADDDIGVNANSMVWNIAGIDRTITDALAWSADGMNVTFTFTAPANLPEGTVEALIKQARDLYGNAMALSQTTRAVHFVDLTGPIAQTASQFPAAGSSTSNTQTEIRCTVTDNLAGLDPAACTVTLQFRRGGNTITQTLGLSGSGHPNANTGLTYNGATGALRFNPATASVPATPYFEDGQVTVTLTVARDRAGNPLQNAFSWQFTVNTSGPKATNLFPSSTVTTNRQHEIRCTIDSAGSEIDTTSIQLKVNETVHFCPSTMLTYHSGTKLLVFNPVAGGLLYPDGTVSISLIQANDTEGFTLQDAPVNWHFAVDTTGPVVVNLAGTDYARLPTAETWITSAQPVIRIPFADTPQASGFNHNTLNFRVNGALPGYTFNSAGVTPSQKSLSATENGYLVSFAMASTAVTLAQGTNSVAVTEFKDLAGNSLKNSALNNWTFMVDSVAPAASGFLPTGYVTSNTETVRVTLSDATSKLDTASVALLVNGFPAAAAFDEGTGLLTYAPPGSWAEGSAQIEIYARDRAGNEVAPGERFREFFVDTIRPVASGGETPFPGAITADLRPEISIVASDGGSGVSPSGIVFTVRNSVEAILPGTVAWDDWRSRVVFTPTADLPEGTVSVSLTTLRDRAGWNIAVPATWIFHVDRSAPTARDIRPVNGELVASRTRAVELTLTDAVSGINPASITLTVNGVVRNVGADLTYDPATGRLRYLPPVPWIDGQQTVTLTQARDFKGLDYTSTPYPLSTVFLVDGSAPVALFTAPTGTITTNAPVVAALTDAGAGIDTASIQLVVSSELNGRLYATGVTGSVLVYDANTLTFSAAAAGLVYPNDTITVSLVAADLVGNQLGAGAGATHRFLRDSLGPVVVVSPDSRVPGPATKPYVNRTDEKIHFSLVDRPSGIDWPTLVVTVTVNGIDRVVPFGDPHLAVNQATGLVTYDPAAAPADLFPTVAAITVTVTEVKDRSPLALAIDKSSPDRIWSFDLDADFVVASDPLPASGAAVPDRMATAELAITTGSALDPATIVFLVNGTTREVGAHASHTLLWNGATGRLAYKPTLATRYDEGTVTVTLARAENLAGRGLQAPFAWSFFVDATPPVAGPLFPLPGQFVNDHRTTVSVSLTDAGSGIAVAGPDRVNLRVKRPGDAAFIDYLLDTSPYLAYDGATLRFNGTRAFVFPEGETRIRLEVARDRAGNMYSGYPLEYGFSVNTQSPTIVSHTPSADAVVTSGNAVVSFRFDTGIGSAGVDTSSVRIGLRNNAAATVEVTLATPGVSWNAVTKTFSYNPAAPFAEGSVAVALLSMRDLEGHDYTAATRPYGFAFFVDTLAPVADAAGATPKSPLYATSGTTEIRIPVSDGAAGSGIDLSTVRMELSYAGSGGTYAVGIGDSLSFEGGALVFRPTVPYQEGTAHVRLVQMRDRAGFDFNPRPLEFQFVVDLVPPLFDDATRSPVPESATDATRPPLRVKVTDSSSGIDLSTLRYTVNGAEFTIASPECTYDPANGFLSHSPAADLPEGTVAIAITQLSDRAGHPATGAPSGIAVPLYGWAFSADRSRPFADNPIPQPGSYSDDPAQNLYLRVRDNVSGVGSFTVLLLDPLGAPIAQTATRNPVTGVITIDPVGPLPSGLLTCRVEAADRAGNALLNGHYTWQFHIVTSGPVATLVAPAENQRTTQNLGLIRWTIDESGEVVVSTIRLTIKDGAGLTSLHTAPSAGLQFAYPNLVFDPRGTPFPEGTTTVTLEMRNNLNKPLSGQSTWLFAVDTKGPKVTPATHCRPAPGAVTDRRTQEVTVDLADAQGAVDPATIQFRVENAAVPGGGFTYTVNDPGLVHDPAARRLTFTPLAQGLVFATGEVRVILQQAKDDLGNDLQDRPVAWSFTVVEDEPFVQANRPAGGAYTRNTAQVIELDLFLPATTTLVKNSLEIELSGVVNKKLGIGDSASPDASPAVTWDPTNKRITVTPAAAAIVFPEGLLTVTVRGVANNLGRVMPAPHVFSFHIDTTPPVPGNGLPREYVASAVAPISIDIADNGSPALDRIDPASLSLRVETGTRSVLFTAPASGLSYNDASSRVLFDPAQASFAYSEGSVSVTLVALADRAGNAIGSTYTWGFTRDSLGPLVVARSPHATVTADPDRTLEISVQSSGAPAAPATLKIIVRNNALTRTVLGTEPGVASGPAAGTITVKPSLAGFALTEGTVSVDLLELSDTLGNPLRNPLTGTGWEWYLDTSGPFVVAKIPPAGVTVTSDTGQELGFYLADLATSVDPASLSMRVEWWNGTVEVIGAKAVTPATPGAHVAMLTGGVTLFSFRPRQAVPPISFANGTASAVLLTARDGVGNDLPPGADRTVEVQVNTNGPVLSDPFPAPGTVLGAGPGTISVRLVSTIPAGQVRPESILVRLYGLEYGATQYPAAIRLIDDRLVVNPAAIPVAFRDGVAPFAVTRALDTFGNNLLPSPDPAIGADNEWELTVDLTGPAASLPDPADGAVVGSATPAVTLRIADFWSAIDLPTARLRVVTPLGEAFATASSYDPATKRAAFDLAAAPLAPGRNDLTLTACADVHGNPLSAPHFWSLWRDAAGPTVSSPYPANGSAVKNRQVPVSVRLTDDLSAVDLATLRFDIANGTLAVSVSWPSPGLFYSSGTLLFDPAQAGLLFNEGTVAITFPGGAGGIRDSLGNAMAANYVLAFAVLSRGPYASDPLPAPGVPVADPEATVSLRLVSEFSTIDLPTVRLQVGGNTYDWGSPALSYAAERLRFAPAALGLKHPEGTVTVALLAARDLAGNPLESAPFVFSFVVDSVGPEAEFGVSPVSTADPAGAYLSLHFLEPLLSAPTLKRTGGDGASTVTTLSPVAGTTTVFATRANLPDLVPPVAFAYSATDSLGNAFADRAIPYTLSTAAVAVNLPLAGGITHLVSFPVLGAGTISAMVGGLPSGGAYAFRALDRDTMRLAATDAAAPGMGFAFAHDAPAPVSFTLRGYLVDRPRLDFRVGLKPGWNLLAAPWRFRMHFAALRVSAGGVERSVADPANAILDRAFFGYSAIDGLPGFDLAGLDSDLEAHRAYLLHARDTAELIIPPAPLTAEEIAARPVPQRGLAPPAGDAGFLVQVKARTSRARDDHNYFGLLQNPAAGMLREPPYPLLPPFVSLRFTVDGAADDFCALAGPLASTRELFPFTVSCDTPGETVTLSWPTPFAILNERLTLVDLATNAQVDMLRANTYAFAYDGERRFRIQFSRLTTPPPVAGADTVRPKVTQFFPKGLDASPASVLRVTVSEPLVPSSVGEALALRTEFGGRDVPGTVRWNAALRELSFTPAAPLEPDLYYRASVMASAIDPAGNLLEAFSWQFKTARPDDGTRAFRIEYGPGWNLISAPLHPAATAVEELFGGGPFSLLRQRGGAWLVYDRRDPRSIDLPAPGLGFWLHLAASREVEFAGAPTGTARPFRIPVYAADWCQFGCPFDTPVEWGAVRFDTGTSEITLVSAVNGGYILPTVYRHEEGAMKTFQAPNGRLEPGRGYFLYARANGTLLVPPPVAGAPARAPRRPLERESAWHVRVTLRAEGVVDDDNLFGCDSVALPDYDLQDAPKMEPPPPAVTLRQPRDFGPFRHYAADFRAPFRFLSGEAEERSFALEAARSDASPLPVELAFAFTRVPADYRLTLVDESTGERTALRHGATVRYLSVETVRRFRVEVEREQGSGE